jgi:predicted metal-dependent hydrolase
MATQSYHSLNLNGRQVDYAVRISPTARRCKIRVSPDGVEVVLPRRISRKRAAALLQEHGDWVLQQLEFMQQPGSLGTTAVLPENTILLRGELTPVEIIAEESAENGGRIDHVEGKLQVRVSGHKAVNPLKILETWLRRQARQDVEIRVAQRSAEMQQQPNCIFIRSQRTKWGTCSGLGNLSFNWRLVMAPPEVLDYVVVHELAHLVEPNHSSRFWGIVRVFCPEFERHKAWLREYESLLHLRGIQ